MTKNKYHPKIKILSIHRSISKICALENVICENEKIYEKRIYRLKETASSQVS